MSRVTGALLAAMLLALAGCSADPIPGPGGSNVDVDTPELRAAKAKTDIPDCVPGRAAAIADGLPEVTLPCLGGGTSVDVSTLRGPMIVNLWASWCGPCRRELPIYEEFFSDYGDQVGVLGVNWQDVQPGAALELAGRSGVSYPVLADPENALGGRGPIPQLRGLPYLVIVDAEGRVVPADAADGSGSQFLEITSEQQLVDLVNASLGTDL